MAPSTSMQSFRSIMTDIRNKSFAPVYILAGEESYYIDKLCNAFIENVVAKEDADFNNHIFYGNDTDIDVFINVVKQYPILADKKLVMLRESQTMVHAKQKLDKLESYMQHCSTHTVLVIVYKGELAPTAKWIKSAITAGGKFFNSPKIRDYELPTVLKSYCTENKIDIDSKSLNILCEHIGTNLQRLFGEVEKLRIAAGNPDKFTITPDLIERHIGISKDFNNFELISALMTKNYAKAMQIVDFFSRNPKDYPMIPAAAMIFSAFTKLLLAHYSKDKSDTALRNIFQTRSVSALKDYFTGIKNYSAWSCVRILHAIREFDCNCKGINSMQDEGQLAKELVYKIFTL